MRLSEILNRLPRYRPQAWLTVRMSAAGLISFWIAHMLGVAQAAWAVLTAIIVTQSSIGGSLKAIVDRFIGTIGGAGWGAAVALAVSRTPVASTGLTLVIALVPLTAIVAFRPSYRMAPVTAVIVLLGFGAQTEIVEAALNRVLEIGLGSVVALGVILLISPPRALDLLCATGRDALAVMSEQVKLFLGDLSVAADPAAALELNDRARTAVERAAAVADEAERERRNYITAAPDPVPLVRTLRRLSHDLVIVARALVSPLPETVAARLAKPAASVAASLSAALDALGAALASRSLPPSLVPLEQALTYFGSELATLRRDGVTRDLPAEAVERVFGLLFGLDEIGRNIEELSARIRELAEDR